MTVLEYLRWDECPLTLSKFASDMWSTNKTARIYLDKKIRGERPWTKKDDKKALELFKKYAIDLSKVKPVH